MKRAELLQHVKGSACAGRVGASGLPLFWRVRVERFGIDLQAVRRADGLAAAIGSAAIAAVLGPDEELAQPVMETVTLTLCESCATGHQCMAELVIQHRAQAMAGQGGAAP